MKKLNRSVAAMLIAASMSMTSCVKDEVSPEVKEMRQAQVALIKAKADLAAADAAFQVISNDYQEAMNAIGLQESEGQLEVNLANIAVSLKTAQDNLVKADLNFKQSLATLQKQVAESGIAISASYLGEYTSAMEDVREMTNDKMVLEAEIAEAKLLIASANAPWEVTKVQYERQLAELQSELAAEESALVSLKEVAANPSTAVEEAKTLSSEIAALQNTNESLKIDQAKALDIYRAAVTKYDNAIEDKDNYLSLKSLVESHTNNLTDYTKWLAESKTELSVETATLTTYKANLAKFETELTSYQNVYNTAKAASDKAQDDLSAAQAAVDVAQNNFNNDNSTANQTKLTDATTARDAAQDALDDAEDATSTAWNELQTPLSARNTAKGLVENQQVTVNNSNDAVESNQERVNYYTTRKANAEGLMTNLQARYDDAVANEGTYNAAKVKSYLDYALINGKISANSDMIENKGDVVEAITTYMTEINAAIVSKTTEIEGTKADIHAKEKAIEANKVDLAEEKANLAEDEAELASLESELAANQALAVKYKALLDASLAQ